MIQNRTTDRGVGGLARVDEDGLLDVKQELLVMCVCWGRDCNSHTVLYVCMYVVESGVDRWIV